MHRPLMILVLAAAAIACTTAPVEPTRYPAWTLDDVSLFPPGPLADPPGGRHRPARWHAAGRRYVSGLGDALVMLKRH